METLRIVIAGGGTGGHVFPALAIGEALRKKTPQVHLIYIGTRRGLEADVIPRAGGELRTLWISGFARRRIIQNLLLPVKLLVSFLQSFWLLLTVRPHVVVGTGGYVMGPVLWVAQRLGMPTVLQEQNSFPGYTTRKLARRAQLVCAGFEETRNRLTGCEVIVTGNPLRPSFQTLNRERARAQWNFDYSRKTLLIFGGSAGARAINEAVSAALSELLKQWNLIWQTGRLGIPASTDSSIVQQAIAQHRLIVREFIQEMPEAYAVADLAVCRAGAMTLAELAASGLPAVLVPYPHAADDHQTSNAQSVTSAGAARIIKDSELRATTLLNTVEDFVASENKLLDMAAKMKSLAKPDAAKRIADLVLSVARKK
ncbi:undecaprenyldiphospho-muramoylpentapeptide beta-N-acetylglucosaminyltransferase [bacterium]|nr:undecaprenyldiphospho-muramoylpentapeptide beta-N-acetylglucosaminyltransferase [bacterium]